MGFWDDSSNGEQPKGPEIARLKAIEERIKRAKEAKRAYIAKHPDLNQQTTEAKEPKNEKTGLERRVELAREKVKDHHAYMKTMQAPKFSSQDGATKFLEDKLPEYDANLVKLTMRKELVDKARDGMIEAAEALQNGPTITAYKLAKAQSKLTNSTFKLERAQLAYFGYAEEYIPEAADNLKKVRECAQKVTETKGEDFEAISELDVAARNFYKQMDKYLIDHALEAEQELYKEVSDEDFIKNIKKYYFMAKFYGEGEMISQNASEYPQFAKEVNQKTQALVGLVGRVTSRMDILCSDIATFVDDEEILKLGAEKLHEFAKENFSMENYENTYIDPLAFSAVSSLAGYTIGACRHFDIDPKGAAGKLVFQNMDGKVFHQDSPEAWEALYMNQEPLYAVPANDPLVEPVLIQPLSRSGVTAVGDEIKTLKDDEIGKDIMTAEPVAKPFFALRWLHSFITLFSPTSGFESCYKYDEYQNSVEALAKTASQAKKNYDARTTSQKLDAAKEKFTAFYKENHPDKTPEQAHEEAAAKKEEIKNGKKYTEPYNEKAKPRSEFITYAQIQKKATKEALGLDVERMAAFEEKMADFEGKTADYTIKLAEYEEEAALNVYDQKILSNVGDAYAEGERKFVAENPDLVKQYKEEEKKFLETVIKSEDPSKPDTTLNDEKKWYDLEKGAYNKFHTGLCTAMQDKNLLPLCKSFANPEKGQHGMKDLYASFKKEFMKNKSITLDKVLRKGLELSKNGNEAKITNDLNKQKNNGNVEQKTEQKTEIQSGMGGNW